jgi:hypothetical protein
MTMDMKYGYYDYEHEFFFATPTSAEDVETPPANNASIELCLEGLRSALYQSTSMGFPEHERQFGGYYLPGTYVAALRSYPHAK